MDLLSRLTQTDAMPIGASDSRNLTLDQQNVLRFRIAAGMELASRVCLWVMIVLIPLRTSRVILARSFPHVYPDYTNLLLFAPDVFLLAVLVMWGLSRLFHPQRIQIGPWWLTAPMIGLTIAGLISIPGSVDLTISAYQAAHLILFSALYLYLLNQAHPWRLITLAAGAQLGIQSVIGVAQVLVQHSLGIRALQELPLDPSSKGVSIIWSLSARTLRAYGLTDHPNILGGCLAISLIFLIAAYIRSNELWRMLLGGLITLGALGLFLTFSRSAWVGLIGGVIILVVWLIHERYKQGIKSLGILGVTTLLVIAPFLWADAPFLGARMGLDQAFTTATPESQSIGERTLLFQKASSLFAEHPLMGVGVGAFPLALRKVQPDYPFDFQPPHLVILDIASETGLLGAVSYLLLIGLPWFFLLRRLAVGSISFELITVSAALMVLSLISLFDYYPWMLEPGRLWLWLLWGLFASLWGKQLQRSAHA